VARQINAKSRATIVGQVVTKEFALFVSELSLKDRNQLVADRLEDRIRNISRDTIWAAQARLNSLIQELSS
jgi:hypothetical protein